MRGARKISWGRVVQSIEQPKTSLLVSGPPQLIFLNTNIIVWGPELVEGTSYKAECVW